MKICIPFLVAVLMPALVWGQQDALGRATAADSEIEILTRGPVHEAFAETITFDPEPGVVVAKAAPDPIEELPPEQKPDGDNVDWISGYWAWDDERNDFLWVSGIWRALPPGREWVPGYWRNLARGSQWISGYWVDAAATEIEYLPEPPQTVEAGPNIQAPSADHTWLPGCWVWQQNRYAWRPGFWATVQPNWVWIPAHYVWAPRGYVFVDGYYDYSVSTRGILFAPVYLNSRIYSQRGYSYSPVTVINPAVFISHLFLRPSYGHYYFGDYYASSYSSRGFSPWFSFHSSRSGYDPFYAHQHWHHRNDREWNRRVEADYGHRRDHEEARPPRTWTAQRDRSTRDAPNQDRSYIVAASLDELARSTQTTMRLKPVAKEERQQIGQRGQEFRIAREARQKVEAETTDPALDASVQTSKPVKVKLPKRSMVAKSSERVEVPPQAIETPLPDISVEPKARKGRSETSRESKTTTREPRLELPDAGPNLERPKAVPRSPVAEPRITLPDGESKLERPKFAPKGTDAEPQPERSKAPKTKSDPPMSTDTKPIQPEPRVEQPKSGKKGPKLEPGSDQTKRKQKKNSKQNQPDIDKGGTDDKPKGNPKEESKEEKDKPPKEKPPK